MNRKVKKILWITVVIFGLFAAFAVWFEFIYLRPLNFNTVESSKSRFLHDQNDFTKMASGFKDRMLLDFCKTGRYEYEVDGYYYDLTRKETIPDKYLPYKSFLDVHPYIQCIKNYISDKGNAVLFEVNSYQDGTSVGYMFKPDNPFKAFGAATSTVLKGLEITPVSSYPSDVGRLAEFCGL